MAALGNVIEQICRCFLSDLYKDVAKFSEIEQYGELIQGDACIEGD